MSDYSFSSSLTLETTNYCVNLLQLSNYELVKELSMQSLLDKTI